MQERSAIRLQVKTILNRIQAFIGFVYQDVRLCAGQGNAEQIEITVMPHGGIRGRCSPCRRPAPGYDRERRQASGDRRHDGISCSLGARLSWRETAQAFQTSWEAVYRSVEWFVEWGLEHRQLDGITSIGVDEIHWRHGMKADNFLTVVYQIDAGCRRLLWIGKRRSEKTLRQGLKALGPDVVKGLRFVCSDMWKPYLNVLAAEAGSALHVIAKSLVGDSSRRQRVPVNRTPFLRHLRPAQLDSLFCASFDHTRIHPRQDRLAHNKKKPLAKAPKELTPPVQGG
ncbi:MAG: transposase [Edaphobacter sp.]|nr:transposase [Edaphobacter sp.]